ncbi:MAG: phosphotransferase [Acidimicrobiia bacterium]
MEPDAILRSISPTATAVDLSAGGNKVFRLREESNATTIVKVFATPSRERRERYALEALAGVAGIPQIISRGIEGGTAWIQMNDGGNWDLAVLPLQVNLIRSAGRLLRSVHESEAKISNLASQIDNVEVGLHYNHTLARLEKFRRRLNLPAEVLERANEAGPPLASAPRPAHTRPTPNQFLVTEEGKISLIDWEWATMAPPEWDVSLATWQFANILGDDAGKAFLDGYGAEVAYARLKSWIAYHSAMLMLEAAESRDGRLPAMAPLVRSLADAVR